MKRTELDKTGVYAYDPPRGPGFEPVMVIDPSTLWVKRSLQGAASFEPSTAYQAKTDAMGRPHGVLVIRRWRHSCTLQGIADLMDPALLPGHVTVTTVAQLAIVLDPQLQIEVIDPRYLKGNWKQVTDGEAQARCQREAQEEKVTPVAAAAPTLRNTVEQLLKAALSGRCDGCCPFTSPDDIAQIMKAVDAYAAQPRQEA